MKRHLAWVLRGADRTQGALEDQGNAIRSMQQRIAELESVVARIDEAAGHIDPVRVAELGERVEKLEARLAYIENTASELVRVVAPPTAE
jgi:uncharacterized coiled-coil protein SlyX